MHVAVAPDLDFEPARQRVDHRHADTVQAAGKTVAVLVELTAGVQPREDQLDTGHLVLGMPIDRHATTIVDDGDGAVLVQRYGDFPSVAGERFVDAVVDHLLHQVIRPRGVGVHARPAPDRLQSGQHLQ